LRKDYSPATIATFIKRARQMFRHASRKRLLAESPFREIKVPSQVNKAREEFIDGKSIAKFWTPLQTLTGVHHCPGTLWGLADTLGDSGAQVG